MATVSFKELPAVSSEDPTSHLETLWKISWPLKSPRPAWKGMMQAVHSSDHPGRSQVFFLPMIDLNPGDLSCIYSTLRFVVTEASKCQMKPVITFDQPLYLKAQSIICSERAGRELKEIVLRLGCFHMQMSFLGSIGNLMAGSGLQEALELVFAPNAVIHMLNGKAYDRAVRGHLLVDAALNALLTAEAFHLPWILIHHESPEEEAGVQEQYIAAAEESDQEEEDTGVLLQPVSSNNTVVTDCQAAQERGDDEDCPHETINEAAASTGDDDLDAAAAFMDRISKGDIPDEDEMKVPLLRIKNKIEEHKMNLSQSRTSKLWLQYLDMIDILRMSIKAERTGNFHLHLRSVSEMLPYFAASGHNNYVKCGRLYLQQMLDLEKTHKDVYKRFKEGHHSIRRSDRYWAGLSSDLIIEQVLMRSLKTNGGLTRGRGMSESERLVWLLSMPACAEINSSMQLVTGVAFSTSEQHKDTSNTRQNRDHQDTRKLLHYFQQRNPFNGDLQLRSLSSGKIADTSVNVDSAKQVGLNILNSMTNSAVADIKFKRQDQAVTLATKSSVTTQGETINVDPTLLFQRLVHLAEKNPESLASVFQYELTNIPTSMFEPSGLPREAKKHALADELWKRSKQESNDLNSIQQVQFVLDGGSLLHRLSWAKGMTYNQVIQSYTEFVHRNYPGSVVVFDGYSSNPSTKDVTHMRRKSQRTAASDTDFDGDMLVCDSRETFLSNHVNKQRFITKLSAALQELGTVTHHAEGDADCLIVRVTLEKAKETSTVLIGQDTDLLVLLICHARSDSCKVFFDTGKRIWDIHAAQRTLGPDICQNILFCHAVGGCDTTSSLFPIGKSAPLQLLQDESIPFKQLAETFAKKSQSDDIVKAGEEALVLLYGGRQGDSLDKLRHVKYIQKLSTSTSALEPKKLPPTTSAAQFHSLRTFYQVQEWMTLGEVGLNPKDWGWEIQDDILFPVYTNAAAAPEELLNIVKCNCKTDCTSARCSCRRHGLVCTTGCGECRGESCTNRVDDHF